MRSLSPGKLNPLMKEVGNKISNYPLMVTNNRRRVFRDDSIVKSFYEVLSALQEVFRVSFMAEYSTITYSQCLEQSYISALIYINCKKGFSDSGWE